jgi:hypothetical protein
MLDRRRGGDCFLRHRFFPPIHAGSPAFTVVLIYSPDRSLMIGTGTSKILRMLIGRELFEKFA